MQNGFPGSSTFCTLNTKVKLLFKIFAPRILQNATDHLVISTCTEGL